MLLTFCSEKGEKSVQSSEPQVSMNPFKYPGMVYIPPGEFIRGTDAKEEESYPETYGFLEIPYEDEGPRKKINLDGYYIDKYEVTIGEYAKFVKATGRRPLAAWVNMKLDIHRYRRYPVSYVNWDDAKAYAKWAGKKLPTEAQWEKAARGVDGRRYPWGNEFDEKKGNFSKKGSMPVGYCKEDVSPFGVYDMGGNVSEWTREYLKPYKGNPSPYRSIYKEKLVSYRGGSWGGLGGHYYLFPFFARSAFRGTESPNMRTSLLGFRCVIEK